MTLSDAIDKACSSVGIVPPRTTRFGKWIQTDTLAGRSGKGDGRLIVDDARVTAWNWQTGEKMTVWLQGDRSERSHVKRAVREAMEDRKHDAERAACIASQLIAEARPSTHAYFVAKGFAAEKALVIPVDRVREIAGGYLVPDGARSAIVMPARIRGRVTSVQLIWEDGTKKFLAGGEIGGACHRIAKGADTWLCEGYATGLSLRAALRSLQRNDTILCCFSASNVAAVCKGIQGRVFIVADNDKPIPQFDGLGTGEHYARQAGRPYLMPPSIGDDLNDMHRSAGIFAVQRLIADFLGRLAM